MAAGQRGPAAPASGSGRRHPRPARPARDPPGPREDRTMTMAAINEATGGAARPAASGLPRLLPLVPGVPEDLRTHLARYGRPPLGHPGGLLINVIQEAGLTGRGGAAFP